MSFRRIAVTGGSGRLGRFVVDELRHDHDVTVVDLVPPDADVAYIQADVLKPAEVGRALAGQDAVVHLAGLDLDRDAAADTFIHVNATGTWNVFQAALDAGIKRVVQCSSIAATGLNEARPDFPPGYLPVDEDHPVAPTHPYGVSKLLQEQIARSFQGRGGLEVASLRVMMVLFDDVRDAVARKLEDPESRFLFYHVSPTDAARAFRCALAAETLPTEPVFITGRDSCREEGTLNWLKKALGALPDIRKPEVYQANSRASVIDGTRAREILGFEPEDDETGAPKVTDSV